MFGKLWSIVELLFSIVLFIPITIIYIICKTIDFIQLFVMFIFVLLSKVTIPLMFLLYMRKYILDNYRTYPLLQAVKLAFTGDNAREFILNGLKFSIGIFVAMWVIVLLLRFIRDTLGLETAIESISELWESFKDKIVEKAHISTLPLICFASDKRQIRYFKKSKYYVER